MDYEKEINELKAQIKRLQVAFLQASENQVPIIEKTDNTASKVDQIYPVTLSNKAYIGDTVSVFECDKAGNVSAWVTQEDGSQVPCTTEVEASKISVIFEPLKKVATVTVSITN